MVVDTPAGGRVTGFYLGTVVKHLPHGKLKVFIPSVYPDEWKDQPLKLPTCMQVTPQFAGSNKGNGVFSYPNIGATVLCGFANGDQNLPFTLGGVLGGENAFGQYEMIKEHDEEVSKRHLITSGKSHLEFYESGKISAAVYDPIRTDASVDYTNNIVSGRHLCEQVSANEISNINCQAVLDNAYKNGQLSTSTHLYEISNFSNTEVLSAEQRTTTVTSGLTAQNDNYDVMNNYGQIHIGELSTYADEFQTNVVDLKQGTAVNTNGSNESNYASKFKMHVPDQKSIASVHNNKAESNFNGLNTKTNEAVISSIEDECSYADGFNMDKTGNLGLSSSFNQTSAYSLTTANPQQKEMLTSTIDYEAKEHNGLEMTKPGNIDLEDGNTSTSSYFYTYINGNAGIVNVSGLTCDLNTGYGLGMRNRDALSLGIADEVKTLSNHNYVAGGAPLTNVIHSELSQYNTAQHLTKDGVVSAGTQFHFDYDHNDLVLFDHELEKQDLDNHILMDRQNHYEVQTLSNHETTSMIGNPPVTTIINDKNGEKIIANLSGIELSAKYDYFKSIDGGEVLKVGNLVTDTLSSYEGAAAVRRVDGFRREGGSLAISTMCSCNMDTTAGLYVEQINDEILKVNGLKRTSTHDSRYEQHLIDGLTKVGMRIEADTKVGTLDSSLSNPDVSGTQHTSVKDSTYEQVLTDSASKSQQFVKANCKAGTLEIRIKDLGSGTTSYILMDKGGNMTIESSTSISMKSPTIKINGTDITVDGSNVTMNGSTTNITGGSGDCKIANVSLLNHVHVETQSGDVVAPGPKTMTAAASN